MSNRITNLLSLCMEAKAKGHDVFFSYYSHTNEISIRSHEDGWSTVVNGDGDVVGKAPDRSFDIYLDSDIGDSIANAEEYLKRLI